MITNIKQYTQLLCRHLRIQNLSTRNLQVRKNCRVSMILTVSTEAGTARTVKGM